MDIRTDDYRIAPLNGNEDIVSAIQTAEAAIAEKTGKEITLIAYEKSEAPQQ